MDLGNITYHSISPRMLNLLTSIHQSLGAVHARHLHVPPGGSDKAYRVSIVHATLALEGNQIDRMPVAELAEDHQGSIQGAEALEAVNTLRVHDLLYDLDPNTDQDLRRAHSVLMHGLA